MVIQRTAGGAAESRRRSRRRATRPRDSTPRRQAPCRSECDWPLIGCRRTPPAHEGAAAEPRWAAAVATSGCPSAQIGRGPSAHIGCSLVAAAGPAGEGAPCASFATPAAVNTRSARLSRGPRLLRAGTLGGCFRQSLPAVACSSRFAQPLQAAGSTKATRAGRLRQRWRRDHLGQAPHFGQSTLARGVRSREDGIELRSPRSRRVVQPAAPDW
jgi:hypothetical protein